MPYRVVGCDCGLRLLKLFPNALLLLRLCRLLFRPVVEAGNPGLDFFEQPVLCGNFPVDGAFLGGEAPALHLRGRDAHVNGGNFLYALPDIAAVIDSLRSADLLQRMVTGVGPCCPPHLGFARIVPVGGIDPVTFETAAGESDTLAAPIEVILLPALRAPFAAFLQRAEGEHDMRVWVSVAFVMNRKIRAHAGGYKSVPDIGADKRNLSFSVKLRWKGNFDFAGKLGIAAFLDFLHAVPEGGTVGKLRRGMGWKKNFRMDYAALFRIIVRDSVPLVCELLSAAVSGGGNGAPALTAFDNFDAAMIDGHRQKSFRR